MNKIWTGLGEKGKVATIIGMFFAFPANTKFIIDFYRTIEYSRESLINLAVINVIAMVWFILPSKISIKGGKGFEIVVED